MIFHTSASLLPYLLVGECHSKRRRNLLYDARAPTTQFPRGEPPAGEFTPQSRRATIAPDVTIASDKWVKKDVQRSLRTTEAILLVVV